MAKSKSDQSNCENDNNSCLLDFAALQKELIKEKEPLPDECISSFDFCRALSVPLSESELAVLGYCAGFFFSKLLHFHTVKKVVTKCQVCSVNGDKITSTSVMQHKSDLFLFLKRYNTASATLYKCTPQFTLFVQVIIQVANFFVEHLLDSPRIVNMIRCTIREHLDTSHFPEFCSDAKLDRFVSYVARTMVVYRTKWLNNDLKSLSKKSKSKKGGKKSKKGGKSTKSKSDKKLEKLMHK